MGHVIRRQDLVEADLRCLMCGRLVGTAFGEVWREAARRSSGSHNCQLEDLSLGTRRHADHSFYRTRARALPRLWWPRHHGGNLPQYRRRGIAGRKRSLPGAQRADARRRAPAARLHLPALFAKSGLALIRPGRTRTCPGRGSLQPPAASRCSARSSLRAPSRGDPPRRADRAL